MKEVTVTVKSAGKVVATKQVKQFDSLAEAVKFFGGEATVLGMINSQYKTNEQNLARQSATTGAFTKGALNLKATVILGQRWQADPELMSNHLANPSELDAAKAEIVAELKAAAATEAGVDSVEDETDDESEEE